MIIGQFEGPFDAHVHMRQEGILKLVAPHTAMRFGAAIIMPNTKPPIVDAKQMTNYYDAVAGEAEFGYWSDRTSRKEDYDGFCPLMTLYLTEQTTAKTVKQAQATGKLAGVKLYPRGATHNSDEGVDLDRLGALDETFRYLSDANIRLLIHGEVPEGPRIDREKEFLPIVEKLCEVYPNLPVVLEHISTAESARFVHEHTQVAATVTPHHLLVDYDSVVDTNGIIRDCHLFCNPIPKFERDRQALLNLAFNCERSFYGSDSAPHIIESKENIQPGHEPVAGIFNTLTGLETVYKLFLEHGRADKFGDFTASRGRKIYDLPTSPQSTPKLVVAETPSGVPLVIDDGHGIVIANFRGGEWIDFRCLLEPFV